jgi:hypothetical protein
VLTVDRVNRAGLRRLIDAERRARAKRAGSPLGGESSGGVLELERYCRGVRSDGSPCGARLSRYAARHDRYCWTCRPNLEPVGVPDIDPAEGLCRAGLHDRATFERFRPRANYAYQERYGARGEVWCLGCKQDTRHANGWT